MTKKLWTISEVMELFQLEESFIAELEEEEILCPTCSEQGHAKLFAASELEKLRIAKTLIEDMDVNLPGVEIILRMRRDMIRMREQFDSILQDLSQHIQESLKHGR